MPNAENPVKLGELTAFKRDCLRIIASEQPCIGMDIINNLREQYSKNVNQSHVYIGLNELVEDGLVDKGKIDGRTNEYKLTEKGNKVSEGFAEMWKNAN